MNSKSFNFRYYLFQVWTMELFFKASHYHWAKKRAAAVPKKDNILDTRS